MGYNKFIKSGNQFELYRYDNDLPLQTGRRKRKSKNSVFLSGVRDGGSDGVAVDSRQEISTPLKRQDNARRAQLAFKRIILSNLETSENPILFTFTYRENVRSLSDGYRDFNAFIRACRYKFGKDFRYITVPEFQRRGAVHFHSLFWGFPKTILVEERSSRQFALLWKKGFIFLKETDGNEKLSSYLSKYMVKAFMDSRLAGQKAYCTSRNILRPVTGSGFNPVWPIVDDYVGVDNIPIQQKEYTSYYLGRCAYTRYNLKKS